MRAALILGIALAALAPSMEGQSLFDQADFKNLSLGGIHLYGVSVFTGYSTSAYPLGSGQQLLPGAAALGADTNYGVSVSLGGQYHRDRTNFSMLYSGSYAGMARYSDTNAINQSLVQTIERE